MNKEQVREQFKKLMAANPPLTEMERLFNRLVDCGALYIEGEPEDSFRLCKTIYYAILCEMCEQWWPVDRQHIREARNLRLFL